MFPLQAFCSRQLFFGLDSGRRSNEVVEKHRNTHLENDPHHEHRVDRGEPGHLPVGRPILLVPRQGVWPRLARCHSKKCHERIVKHAEVGGVVLAEDGHRNHRKDAQHQREDEEDVEHGERREGEGRDDLAQRLDAPEEADHAQGTQHAHHAAVAAAVKQGGDEGGDDDGGVEDVPGVEGEGLEPVGVGVDDQLRREGEREGEVQVLQLLCRVRLGPVAVGERVDDLRLDDGAHEVRADHEGDGGLERK
mmetsp:Transcript_60836/g.162728  ORF Transcript_60836/g.162728 Transcript_60836/m.162728 type:complete len:249 (+) Transcript_60836:2772-3518(+)